MHGEGRDVADEAQQEHEGREYREDDGVAAQERGCSAVADEKGLRRTTGRRRPDRHAATEREASVVGTARHPRHDTGNDEKRDSTDHGGHREVRKHAPQGSEEHRLQRHRLRTRTARPRAACHPAGAIVRRGVNGVPPAPTRATKRGLTIPGIQTTLRAKSDHRDWSDPAFRLHSPTRGVGSSRSMPQVPHPFPR